MAVLVVPYCGSFTVYRYRQVPPGNPLHLLYPLREMFSMTAYKDDKQCIVRQKNKLSQNERAYSNELLGVVVMMCVCGEYRIYQ